MFESRDVLPNDSELVKSERITLAIIIIVGVVVLALSSVYEAFVL